MASKMKRTKAQRASKTSKGIHGGGGNLTRPFTEVEKVLLNKGMLHGVKERWRKPAPVTE